MGLGDVSGIFSRYFVIGFFLPSFFILVGLGQTLSSTFLPPIYENARPGAQIAILGGAGLLVGLVLLGLNYQIIRLFEGYPLSDNAHRWLVKPLFKFLQNGENKRFRKMVEKRDRTPEGVERRNMIWRLDQRFPTDPKARRLPTRLGNAIKASERYSSTRWGLNAIAAWSRIELLLSTDEATSYLDAKANLAFFLNGALLAALAGAILIADEIVSEPLRNFAIALYAIPFVLSWALVRASLGAAQRWGDSVRACVDVHRLELYERMGLRSPTSFSDEKALADALSAAILRGEEIPHDYWSRSKADGGAEESVTEE